MIAPRSSAPAATPATGFDAMLGRLAALARALLAADGRVAAALYAVAVLLAGAGLLRVAEFYHDDAYISLRYAARLLAGEGLSWNAGERVEGFTHPLWLAQVALLGGLGVDLVTASRALGAAYLFGFVALWRRARATPLFLLLIVTQPGLLWWSVSGLETTSFAFWLALGAWLTWEATGEDAGSSRLGALAGAALAAAALTRPEGMGAGVVAVACLAAARRWSAAVAAACTFGATFGAYEAFRLAYFGELLPNTAHAKLGGLPLLASLARGLQYLRETSDVWAAAALAALVGIGAARSRRVYVMLLVSAPVLLSLLMAGGDHMPLARLVVPVVVVWVFAAALAGRAGFRRAAVVGSLALLATAGQLAVLMLTPVERDPAAVAGEHVGRFLQAYLPPGATVATATAGSTPYHAPALRFIDTLGLNDRHIARRHIGALQTRWQEMPGHLKGDGAYILRRAPDVIVIGPAAGVLGDRPTEWFLTDYELLTADEFHSRYTPYRFPMAIEPQLLRRPLPNRVDNNPVMPITLYLRNDSPAVADLAAFGVKPIARR